MDPAVADLHVFRDAALEVATRAGDAIVALSHNRAFEVRPRLASKS
jgi:hypothetical protein